MSGDPHRGMLPYMELALARRRRCLTRRRSTSVRAETTDDVPPPDARRHARMRADAPAAAGAAVSPPQPTPGSAGSLSACSTPQLGATRERYLDV